MIGLALLAQLALAAQVAAAPAPDGKVIVRLASRHSDISVLSTAKGVRYSAIDKSGRILVTQATLDELKDNHPDLYRVLAPALCSATASPEIYATIASD